MNEQLFKNLVKQAGLDDAACPIDEWDNPELKEFVRLIVQECVDACWEHADVERFGIYPIRVAMVTKACERNIQRHFGYKTDDPNDEPD